MAGLDSAGTAIMRSLTISGGKVWKWTSRKPAEEDNFMAGWWVGTGLQLFSNYYNCSRVGPFGLLVPTVRDKAAFPAFVAN